MGYLQSLNRFCCAGVLPIESQLDLSRIVPYFYTFVYTQGIQWQLGAVAIFLAWIDLVLFIRKVPRFGIYVVMFTDVFNTFMKFSFVFLLFIIAFGLSFHVLMANQVNNIFNTIKSLTNLLTNLDH